MPDNLYITSSSRKLSIDDTQTTIFTFDAADCLTDVVMPDTTQFEFAYEADGQRVSQFADG